MQFTKKTILIGTAALVGVAAIGGTAVAATGIVSDTDDARHAEFERELAEKLGVPQADVERALGEMHTERTTERLGELVAAGKLSQAQADAIQQQVDAGQGEAAMQALRAALLGNALTQLVQDGTITQAQGEEAAALASEGVPIGVRGMEPGHDGRHADDPERQARHLEHLQEEDALTAQEAAEIQALIDAGKAAEAEQRIHAATDAYHLDELVEDGVITQAQADRVQALIDAGAPIGIGGPGMDGGKGHHGKGDHGKGDHGDRHDDDDHGDHGDHGDDDHAMGADGDA
ncbi:MAG: hypothetical protein ACKO7U_06545 [Actinomycetota bacterium]